MLAPYVARLHIVNNGLAAIEALQTQAFDLVLMDVQMPVLSGVDAALAIRKLDTPLGQIPIVALTANALVSDRERFLQSGFNDYLSKPFRRNQLLSVVQRVTQSVTPHTPDAHVEQTTPGATITTKPDSTATPPPWFNAALFQDNFSVFDRSEQLKLLTTAGHQIEQALLQLQNAQNHQHLHDIEQVCHRLAGAMGAVALEQLSQMARTAMEQAQQALQPSHGKPKPHVTTLPAHLLVSLHALEQHAQDVLRQLKQPASLLAPTKHTSS